MHFIYYIPVATTLFGLYFFQLLFNHWKQNKKAMHVCWWMIGVFCYIAGTVSESVNTLAGFSIADFKIWYITGALLGGAPLAQGTVYLLCKRKTANVLTTLLLLVIVVSTVLVILSPVNTNYISNGRLSGEILGWHFIRYMTPFINLYAFIFLVGGAIYSAFKYAKNPQYKKRFVGNILIAVGGLLPGIGGSFTKFGYVEVLYVTEFVGLILIFQGYKTIRKDSSDSLHVTQQFSVAS